MAQKPEKDPSTGRVENLAGVVERFTFRNAETGFAVVRFRAEDGTGTVAAVGQLAQLAEGQQVRLTGRRVEHPRFGTQVEVESAEVSLPQTTDGIRAYLSSGLVKGIGPATAERIVARFGADTLRIIEHEPERLAEIKGIGEKRRGELVSALAAQRDVQEVIVFLRAHGLGPGLATRIVKHFGRNASARIAADPYRLADEVFGIGFRTADRLARNLGLAHDAPERVRAGVLHVLSLAAREGHCFVPRSRLAQRVATLLECDAERADRELPQLAAAKRIVVTAMQEPDATDSEAVYPLVLEAAERGVATLIVRATAATAAALPIDPARAIAWFESHRSMQLPAEQRDAITTALTATCSVITGGPGVGKTTILRAIADVMAAKNLTLLLAAPTGRAAKRLEESTGHGARTIHRLLEFQAGLGRFMRDDQRPLEGHMLVVDEASMLDVRLAYDLLRAVPIGMRVVLVGDVDQLPAVGPGNVLGDVIRSGRVPVTHLTRVFRQHGGSRIVTAAHQVLDGVVPESGGEASDFYFVATANSAATRSVVRELVTQRIPSAFELDPLRDIQVLCPMYRGDAGADRLNADLQEALNPGRREIERGGRRFREGDKVMQTQNDYDRDVFNGDVGRITRLDERESLLCVDYGERTVPYSFSELDQLVPAYAISVHRSQGSEYPAVVVPLATEHFLMLRRNVLYTAITRGKRLVVLVGSRQALATAVGNRDESARWSGLAARLRAT